MDTASSPNISASAPQPEDGLFDEALVERVELVVDDVVDARGGVNKRFRAFDPDAVMLVPPSLDEWLPEGHLARCIAELVDNELDLSRFYASHKKAKGQPPYDPRLMLRIMLYGYCVGVRSSRQVERACTDVVAFRWLAAQQGPDFRSIARFRERHLAALANVFLQALQLCQAAGMVSLGKVALDGDEGAGQRVPAQGHVLRPADSKTEGPRRGNQCPDGGSEDRRCRRGRPLRARQTRGRTPRRAGEPGTTGCGHGDRPGLDRGRSRRQGAAGGSGEGPKARG